jgi:hypothetical protein
MEVDGSTTDQTQVNSLTIAGNRTLRCYGGLGSGAFTMASLTNEGTMLFDQTGDYGCVVIVGSGGSTPVITNSGTINVISGTTDSYRHRLIGGLTNYGTIDGASGYLSLEGDVITQSSGSMGGAKLRIMGGLGSRFVVNGGTVGDSVSIESTVTDAVGGSIGRANVNSDTLELNGLGSVNRTLFYGRRLNILAPGTTGRVYPLTNGVDVAYYTGTACTVSVWNRIVDLATNVVGPALISIETTGSSTSTLNAPAGTTNHGTIRFASMGSVGPQLSLGGTFTNGGDGVVRSDVAGGEIRNGTMVNEGLIEVAEGNRLSAFSPTLTMNGGAIIAGPDLVNGGSSFRIQSGATFVYNGGTADTVSLATGASADVRSGAGPGAIYTFNRNATCVQNQSPLVTWLLGTGGTSTATLTMAAGAENRGKVRIAFRGTEDPYINLLGSFSNYDTLQCDVLAQITGGTFTNTGVVIVSPGARLLIHCPTFLMNGGAIVAGTDSAFGASTFWVRSGSTFVYNGGTADTVRLTSGSVGDVRAGAGPGTLRVFNNASSATLARNEAPSVSVLVGTGGSGAATLIASAGAINRGRILFDVKGSQNPVLSFAGACTNATEGVIASQINAGDFGGTGILTNHGTLKTEIPTGEIRAGARLGNYASGVLTGGHYDLTGKLRITGAAITKVGGDVMLRGPSAGILNQSTGGNALAALAAVGPPGALRLFSGHRFNTTATTLADSGVVEVADACTLQVGGGTGSLIVDSAGFLGGGGRVVANTTNRGTAAPGASAGRLSVQGTYSQTGTGRLVVEIGGDSAGVGYDVLSVIGTASINGSLEVRFIDGYQPPENTVFDVLTGASVTGQFSAVSVVDGQASIVYWPGKVSVVTGTLVGVPTVSDSASDSAHVTALVAPVHFGIHSVAPNPFRTSTAIRFGLTRPEVVRLEIYDATGRRVQTLVDGAQTAGAHSVPWNGQDQRGAQVGPGFYFARLTAATEVSNRKFLLVR